MCESIRLLKSLTADRKGVTAVEYAVIAGVICATLAGGFVVFANNLSAWFAGLNL